MWKEAVVTDGQMVEGGALLTVATEDGQKFEAFAQGMSFKKFATVIGGMGAYKYAGSPIKVNGKTIEYLAKA